MIVLISWFKNRYGERPAEREEITPGTLIQRRNIHEVTVDDRTVYECEERWVDGDAYAIVSMIEEISTDKAIDDYTEQLIEEGIL